MNKITFMVVASLMSAPAFAAETTSAVVQPNEGTTLSAPAAAVVPAKNPIKVSYAAETAVGAADADHSNWDGAVVSLQHVGIKYELNKDQALQFRQYFGYNLTDEKKTDEWGISHSVLRFTDNKELMLGDIAIAGDTRLYIPVAELDREIGQYILRHDAMAEQEFGKLKLSYGVSARGYMYTEKADGQTAFRVLPIVGAEYAVNKVLTPYVLAFTDHRWYHTGSGIEVGPVGNQAQQRNPADNSDKFKTDLGARIALGDKVMIDAYVESAKDLRSNQNFDLFEADNNFYEVDLTISM